AAIRSVTKAAGLRLNRHSGNSYAVRRYRSITLEIPEVLFASLVVAAARRNVPTDQLAVGILGGVLCAGNVERTLGPGDAYSFMRFRTSPEQAEYHRTWKRKTRSAEATSVAGMESGDVRRPSLTKPASFRGGAGPNTR